MRAPLFSLFYSKYAAFATTTTADERKPVNILPYQRTFACGGSQQRCFIDPG
jgi:hypothetical protein